MKWVKFISQWKNVLLCTITLCLILCAYKIYHRHSLYFAGGAFVTSVSTDGNYAITTNDDRYAILWDIKHHTYKVLSDNANIYSAYFIKNTSNYMWQDLKNSVHIESMSGQEIKSFQLDYPTYGEVMTSDLTHYIASDQAWNVYEGYGKEQKQIKSAYQGNGFLGDGKLLNITLSNDNNYFLTSGASGKRYDEIPISAGVDGYTASKKGYEVGIVNLSLLDGVVLWSVASGQPLVKYVGNTSKTYATFSPDDKYVVGSDEGSRVDLWHTLSGKFILEIEGIVLGRHIPDKDPKKEGVWDNSGLIPLPKDFTDENGLDRNDFNLSVKFIDGTYYLRFITSVPYAILYSITDPKPLKYLKLNTEPYPSIDDYSRDQSIDTSPSAHILVIGHRDVPGVTVYQYDPVSQTLKVIWNVET